MTNTPVSTLWGAKPASSSLIVGPHNIIEWGSLILNDRSQLACYWIEEFDGFDDAELRTSSDPNPQDDGGIAGPGFYGARTMTMTGFVRAGSYTQCLDMQRALADALMDLVEQPMVIRINPASTVLIQAPVYIFARKADKLLMSKKTVQKDQSGTFERSFTISLRAEDPVYLATSVLTQSFAPQTVLLPGRVYSRTYDMVYDHYMDEANNPTGEIVNPLVGPGSGVNDFSVFNAGNWYARPKVTFHGYMKDVRLLNNTNGHEIRIKYPILAGDSIVVDVANGTVQDAAGVNRASYFDTSSDWLRLVGTRESVGGENVLTLIASSYDGTASVDISWQSTWL